MSDLRDQLLKAGLVSETEVKSAEQKERARKKAKGHRRAQADKQAAKQRVKDQMLARQEADRQRGLEKRSEDEQKELDHRVLQIAETGRISERVKGRRRWYFLGPDGTLPFLDLSDAAAGMLERGEAAIIQSADGRRTEVVTTEAARRIHGIDPGAIRHFNGRLG